MSDALAAEIETEESRSLRRVGQRLCRRGLDDHRRNQPHEAHADFNGDEVGPFAALRRIEDPLHQGIEFHDIARSRAVSLKRLERRDEAVGRRLRRRIGEERLPFELLLEFPGCLVLHAAAERS